VTAGVTRQPNEAVSRSVRAEIMDRQVDTNPREATEHMSILWIILIVILVLALLGFFSRGYW
jgi:flagellar basal body-associated protein FliL